MEIGNDINDMEPVSVDAQQGHFLERRLAEAIEGQPQWEQFSQTLLRIGGTHIAAFYEEDLDKLVERGEVFTSEKAVLRKGQPIRCHENSRALWAKNPQKFTVCTGWALSVDGIWRQHSWAYDKKASRVVETTMPRVTYFGYRLTDEEAQNFG